MFFNHTSSILTDYRKTLFEQSEEIYETDHAYQQDENESDGLNPLNKILIVSLSVFGLATAAVAGHRHYYPINQAFETGIGIVSLISLTVAAIVERAKEFEMLRSEVLDLKRLGQE
ncbi:MAG: hypothetical protein AAGE99_05730 [Chlamydiota bacterium]